MPRSPSEFGYEYTVAQYRAHLQNPDRRNLQSFSSFREKLWRDAISNPELSQFFEECLAKVSTKGKYYCRVWTKEPSLQVVLSRDDGKIHFEQNGELSGIHFLTFLEDLFDHNEDPIRCGTD
uniref:Uncharacterized protein n=1 Tax=Leptocylindrus danicus TaxID=163516 RepID=A0A7S2PP57_9STRA|mmetsp:Transcript_6539/g.9661  ORF Transcript_6539/g.9661 Transcript_6539/m.9661 type:complete len:122 (+) Transcript_6539:241-606(+)